MKLCPQCEFIYEDDQNLCDMDGEALVCDNRLGVFPRSSPTVPAITGARLTKAQLRIMVAAIVAGLVFPTLLCLAYYSSSTLFDSTFASRSAKPEAPETSRQQHIAPQQDNSLSSPVINPSQSSTNSEAASEPVSNGTEELKDRPALLPARTQVVTKAADNTSKAGGKRLAIGRGLTFLPQLTPLPRLPLPKRLPAAKPGARVPGSTTPPKREFTNQKLELTSQKTSVREVKPARGNASKQSRVKSFLKKTGRILKKPFQL